ncbi:MAG: hypothetical protein GYA02_17780, partial [Clostridiaceae bacterium]|nr:hypothetical protein [Clostridiaceae bacterium]
IKEIWETHDDNIIHKFHTPIGTIQEVLCKTEGEHRTKATREHFIKDLDSLKIMKYVAEGTYFQPDYQPVFKALEETGDDGIVLHMSFCVPFIQFAKTDAGYLNGYYLWKDYREEVDSLVEVYHYKFLEGYKILADGPADVISTGDNMDGTMISPPIFKEYAMPFYQDAKKILAEKGKIFEGHWCGRTQNLLDLVPECGLDVVEAIVTKPMADIELKDALDKLQGKVVLQGGIPSVLVCNEGATDEEFKRYFENVILPLKGRKGFILGMSDNVPPNANFSRVEAVAEMIN